MSTNTLIPQSTHNNNSSSQSHATQSTEPITDTLTTHKPLSTCPCAHLHPNRRCIKHTLVTFGRAFYIAYGLRSGLSLALHIIKILRSKNPRDIFNLQKLIAANGLPIDAVRIGLLFGGFSGIYSGVQCLLARMRKQHNPTHTFVSGAVAGLSILSLDDSSSRRTLALYMMARVVQSWYNNQKQQNKFHFYGSDWAHGDSLLFTLSCAQIMYAYVMRPESLPPSYFSFMLRTAPIDKNVLKCVQLNNRNLPFDTNVIQKYADRVTPKNYNIPNIVELLQPYITKQGNTTLALPPIVPCSCIHPQCPSCSRMILHSAMRAAKSIAPVYMSLTFVPMLFLQFWPLMRNPTKLIGRGLFSSFRSTAFISLYVTSYMGLICAHRKVFSRDHRSIFFLIGLLSPWSILLERKSRRAELALYVLPRALDSFYLSVIDRADIPRIPYGTELLFCLSMGALMYCRDTMPDTMSPLLRRILNFFIHDTNIEKSHTRHTTPSQHTNTPHESVKHGLPSSGSLHILPSLDSTTTHPAAISTKRTKSIQDITEHTPPDSPIIVAK